MLHPQTMYRSVPLIGPPILYTTSRLKWGGGGVIFEDAISLDYKPPPKKDFTQVLCTQLGHFQSSCLHRNTVRGLPTSEKSCQFNARSITFTTTSTAGVTGNPIRAYTDPGGSDPLAESICRIGSASESDPPPDQFY